jgi:hypothetical protein
MAGVTHDEDTARVGSGGSDCWRLRRGSLRVLETIRPIRCPAPGSTVATSTSGHNVYLVPYKNGVAARFHARSTTATFTHTPSFF